MEAELKQRLAEIRRRIAAACQKSGRDPDGVRLIGVTKYVTPEIASALHRGGLYDFGESRPQELWSKAAALPSTVRWHLIGHLQRNKVERTLPLVTLIHSVDSVRLLDAINAAAHDRTVPVLLEVNASRESAKHGFAPDDVLVLGDQLRLLKNVEVRGLMTMAAVGDAKSTRATFSAVRQLRDEAAKQWGLPLPELSMGMTNDFEVAIEEGATMVRIGSALFEGIV